MKRLVIVNGPMGVGKTTVCRALKKPAAPCAFLDGDWCWDMEPFVVTEETRTLVQDNIVHLLQSFLDCPAFETVLFCWVLHRQEILDGLLARLDLRGARVRVFTLTAEPETLRAHIEKDAAAGLRTLDVWERSLARLPLYEAMDTEKLPVEGRTPAQLAEEIWERLNR